MNLRSALYFTARRLGDLRAIQRGTILQRLARSFLLRKSGGLVSRLFR